ncbi:MAG: YIP1 family protein [bacterium]|nr:YIP1 family protein [bacterium]
METPNEPIEQVHHEPPVVNNIPKPNLFQKIIWVFSNPYELGKHLKFQPQWLLPVILNMLLIIPLQIILYPQTEMKMEEEIRKSFENSKVQVSDDQQEKIIETSKTVAKFTTPLLSAMSVPLIAVITTWIWMFVGNLLIGGEAKFRELFAVITWTMLIVNFGGWIKAPIVIVQNTVEVYLGPAVFLSNDASKFLKTFLAGLDFFYLWQAIAEGIAIAAIYQWSKTKGVVLSLLIFIIAMLVIASLSLF